MRTLLRDTAGDLRLGTDGAGLIRVHSGHAQHYTTANSLANDFIRVLLQSRDGSLWVGTDGGITHLGPKGAENFGVANGLAYFSITALLEDLGWNKPWVKPLA